MRRFNHILVLVDDKAASWPALNRATDLAWRHGARLTAIAMHEPEEHMGVPPGSWSQELDAVIHEHLDQKLHELLAPFRDAGYKISTATSVGSSLEVVSETLEKDPFDLLVKGALETTDRHSPALAESDRILLESCPTPVWFEPTSARPHIHRVIAALDPFSPEDSKLNRAIMDLSSATARREGADLELILGRQRVVTTSRDPDALLNDVTVIPVVGSDQAKAEVFTRQVLDAAVYSRPDLIVMGSSVDELPEGLSLADTTDRVLRAARPAVLTLKPEYVEPRLSVGHAA